MVHSLALPTRSQLRAHWYELSVAGLVLAGVALRFWGIGNLFMTYDEGNTALIAQLPLARLIAATAGDVHPPGTYLILALFTRLVGGVTATTLRFPGAVASSLAMLQLVALARRLSLGQAATLAGLALFALSPFQVQYAQDARMYPWLQLAVLGALIAAFDRRYLLMAAWLTLALWTHNYGLIYWAAIAPVVLLRELSLPIYPALYPGEPGVKPEASRFKHAVYALALPVLLWLPWAPVLISQMHMLATGYWIPPLNLGQWLFPFYSLAWSVALPLTMVELGAIVLYGFLAFALWKGRHDQRLLIWLVLGPALLAGAGSLVWKSIYLFRALIGVAAPMMLLIGWAVTQRTTWLPRAWAAAVLGMLLVAGLANREQALQDRLGENQVVVDLVTANWQPGDIVYHGNVGSLTGFLSMGPKDLGNFLMPVVPGSVGQLTLQTRTALGFCEGPLTPHTLQTTCGMTPWKRAWLVWGASQTISGVEDAAVAQLLAEYPHEKLLDIHDVYKGPLPLDGGLWLLTNPEGESQ